MDIKKWNEIPGSSAVQGWPYTNLHDLNLDWIINTTKEFAAEISRFEDNVTSEVGNFENSVTVKIGEFEGTMQEYTSRMDTALATVEEKIEYIDNFFSSLDVQQEINNKLNSMAGDGSLAALLKPFADAYMQQDAPGVISAWLAANITEPVGVVIDSSLTVAGAAADARAAGTLFGKVVMKTGNSTNLNDREYLEEGVFALAAGRTYSNAPASALNSGWLLQTFPGLYNNNNYVSQFLSDQNGLIWHRYISRQGTNASPWALISSATITAPSNDFNNVAYKSDSGIYLFPANTQLTHSPNDAYMGGWVLEVTAHVFSGNNYVLQTARDQYGTVYSRYASMTSAAMSSWYITGQSKNTVYMSFGDSITAGHGVSAPYPAILGQHLGAYLTRNASVSATGWMDNNGGSSAYEQVINANYNSVSIITLAWGINDYRTNKILGSIDTSEEGDATVIGQMKKVLRWLQTNHPDALTVVLLPINITEVGNISTNFAMNYANSNGDTLANFITAMKECCDYMQIPYIDIHKYSGFGTYSLDSYLLDTVHPTQEAHYRIAGIVKQHFPSANLKY